MVNPGKCSSCGLWYEQDHQHHTDHECLKATQAALKELAQGIEDLIAVATKDEDGDGFVTAYHFKTGAMHRLLGRARQLSPGVIQNETVPEGVYEGRVGDAEDTGCYSRSGKRCEGYLGSGCRHCGRIIGAAKLVSVRSVPK
jgi:hypothetical protein